MINDERPHALKMKVSCAHSEPGVGAKCNTIAPGAIPSAHYLYRRHDVFPVEGPLDKPPGNHYRKRKFEHQTPGFVIVQNRRWLGWQPSVFEVWQAFHMLYDPS